MPRAEIVSISTKAQIRNRRNTETLTVERDFWMKEAEDMHDQLENIFEQARANGRVEIYQNGTTIKLMIEPEAQQQ